MPISLPSSTHGVAAAIFLCNSTILLRTLPIADTAEASIDIFGSRMACDTSAPSRYVCCTPFSYLTSIFISFIMPSTDFTSVHEMPSLTHFSAHARYIAPVSRQRMSSCFAISRETVLFPLPAGPSMAIFNLSVISLLKFFAPCR